MSNDKWYLDDLNQRAFTALQGLSTDRLNPVVELLRSNAPISSAVRSALADSIEGSAVLGVQLIPSGHEKLNRWREGWDARRNWFYLGSQVDPFVRNAPTVPDGFTDAEEHLGLKDSYCRKAYYYWKRCTDWKMAAKASDAPYSIMDDDALETEFHFCSLEQKTDNPMPGTAEEYAATKAERVAFARRLFGSTRYPDMAVQVFLFLCRLPPSDD